MINRLKTCYNMAKSFYENGTMSKECFDKIESLCHCECCNISRNPNSGYQPCHNSCSEKVGLSQEGQIMNLLVDKNLNIFNIQGIDIARLVFQKDTDEFKIELLTLDGIDPETLSELNRIRCEWNGNLSSTKEFK